MGKYDKNKHTIIKMYRQALGYQECTLYNYRCVGNIETTNEHVISLRNNHRGIENTDTFRGVRSNETTTEALEIQRQPPRHWKSKGNHKCIGDPEITIEGIGNIETAKGVRNVETSIETKCKCIEKDN